MNLTLEPNSPKGSPELLSKLSELGCTSIESERIVSDYPTHIITVSIKKVESNNAVRLKAPYLLRLLEIEMEPIRRQESEEHQEEQHRTKKELSDVEHARLKALIQSLSPERLARMKDYIGERLHLLPLPTITKERVSRSLQESADPHDLAEDGRIIIALRLSLQTKL